MSMYVTSEILILGSQKIEKEKVIMSLAKLVDAKSRTEIWPILFIFGFFLP